jgi:hypothetical protein
MRARQPSEGRDGEGRSRLQLLVLYDPRSVLTEFVEQHLAAIKRHSRHEVHYAAATFDRRADFPLELYDALIIHFSVRLPFDTLAPDFVERVSTFDGPKILMIQDEYDMPAKACAWMRRLGIRIVFTTVPPEYRAAFYPPDAVPGIEFRQCLTGYIPDALPTRAVLPIGERSLWIAYRGRKLPIWYGSLAREKYDIGVRMRAVCRDRSIPHDIECDEAKRIYGNEWFTFLAGTRTTLGTESGSNVVDAHGDIRARAQALWRERPDLPEQEVYRSCIQPFDGSVRMNQISPKIFEAIALRTGLVLFEGAYSGVLQPDEHFIPLRKDFTNIDDVLRRVADAAHVQEMVDRAYGAIVASGRYGYDRFVAGVDAVIEQRAGGKGPRQWTYVAVRCQSPALQWAAVTPHLPLSWPIQHHPLTEGTRPLLSGRARQVWLSLPEIIRRPAVFALGPIVRFLVSMRNRSRSGREGGSLT